MILAGILDGLVTILINALNAFLGDLGIVLAALISLLPNMPALPTMPTEFTTAASWVAWFFPVSTVWDILIFTGTAWLLWYVVSIALRWAKAINS